MNWAQITIVILLALGFLVHLHWDVEGREAKAPAGYGGVLGTVIIYAFHAFLYYKAGLFGN